MDFCETPLPQIWAIEALACSNHVEPSLLIDFLKKTPQICNDIGANARELVSLKLLECYFIQESSANPESSALSKTVKLDPSDRCEDVLQRILSETSLSHLKPAEAEMSKWDLEPFILHKRSMSPKYALKQLKDAILTGSRSISAYLKEKSGLPVKSPEHQAPPKDINCNGSVEGSDTNESNHLPMELSDENLVTVNRKRRVTENPSKQLSTTLINPIKQSKHDVVSNEQYGCGQLISLGAHTQILDTSIVSMQHIEGKRCRIERKTNVGNMRLLQPSERDNSECISSDLGEPSEVLPCREQLLLHCDDSELNYNSEEQQSQEQNIEEESGNEARGHEKANEDVDTFGLYLKNVDEVEENVHVSNDEDGNYDGKINIASKENSPVSGRYTDNQYSFKATNSRDQILLANTSERYSEARYTFEEQTCVEVMMQNESPGDSHNQCNASKGLLGNGHIFPHCASEVPNEKFDVSMLNSKCENTETGRKGFHGLSTNEDIDKFYQNDLRTIPTVSEAGEDVRISSDDDGFHDERNTIDAKKKTFLSSQSTYSQATTDDRELHLCMKCNKGGNVLSCTSDSCTVVIHESCLGSDGSFDPREIFYCPFCAYSRAISRYMEVKQHTSLARKELTAFICLEPQNEPVKQSRRSFLRDGNCLKKKDGLPKNDEQNKASVVEKVNNNQSRKKREFEQVSELRSDYSPPFGRKAVESTDGTVQSSKSDKQDGKRIKQESQSRRGCRQQSVPAEAVHHFQSETMTSWVPETSESEKHADVRSERGVPHPPEIDLSCDGKCSQSLQSADPEERYEDKNENSGASRYLIRFRNQERQNLYPEIPQLKRERLPWTSEEEDVLKNGVHLFCSRSDRIIHWKKILKFGEGIFHPSRSTMDLKDNWKNICKARQISR